MSVAPLASDGMALAPVVAADGTDLPAAWSNALVELRVRRAVRTIGRCTMRFVDPGYTLAQASKLKVGTPVRVTAKGVEQGATATVVFQGKVTSTGVEHHDGGQPELHVVAEDLAFEISRSARAATFLNLTASQIVEKVVRAAGARPSVTATSAVLEYTLQTDTDLAFVDELCRRNGLDWEMDGSTFRAWALPDGTGSAAVRLAVGDSVRDFSARVYADAPSSVRVRGWDHLKKTAVVGDAQTSRSAVPDGLGSLAPASGLATATVLDAQAGPVDQSDAEVLAKAVGRLNGAVLARGRCEITPTLRPGVLVQVRDGGPSSGTYYVREVEHTYRPAGFHTSFVAGDREPGTLVAPAVATGTGSSFTHDGLVVGLVSAIDQDPQAAGRVKVSLPGLDSTIESQWARLAVLGGGADRGMVFLPEVGDEVLVGFEGGDVRRPVVLGGLFGTKDKIPASLVADGAVAHRTLTSRLGHVVELADGRGPDTQHIRLALAGGEARLRIGKDKADLTLPDGVPLTIASGSSSIKLDGNGAITLSGTTISIKATQDLTLEGVQVTAKGTAKVAASAPEVDLKADGTATLQSSGITAVKGSMVQIN